MGALSRPEMNHHFDIHKFCDFFVNWDYEENLIEVLCIIKAPRWCIPQVISWGLFRKFPGLILKKKIAFPLFVECTKSHFI